MTGQVLGSLIQTMISVCLVVGVALLMGFRPTVDLVSTFFTEVNIGRVCPYGKMFTQLFVGRQKTT